MGRGGLGFLEHWHRKELKLSDGRILTWVVIDRLEPWIAMFSLDGKPIYRATGHELLACAGHPDAELTLIDSWRDSP